MGIYINPPDQDKVPWLEKNGLPVPSAAFAKDSADFKTLYPVCLVSNGHFTAAGVVDSEREFEAFNLPDDHRPKMWFLVHIDKLTDDTIGEVYAKHLRRDQNAN